MTDKIFILAALATLAIPLVAWAETAPPATTSATAQSTQYSFSSVSGETRTSAQPLGAFAAAGPRGYWGVKIGETWWENQRNGSMRRMITWGKHGPVGSETMLVHFSWMYYPTPPPSDRQYRYDVYDAQTGTFGFEVCLQPLDEYGGFTVIDVTNDDRAIVGGHNKVDRPSGPYQSQFYWDFLPGISFFVVNCRVPDGFGAGCEYNYIPDEDGFIWPSMCWQEGLDTVLHVFALENNGMWDAAWPGANQAQALMYFRSVNPETSVPSCPWSDTYCVDTVFTFGHDCDCLDNGKVAIAWIANVQDPSDPCAGGDTCSSTYFVAEPECDNDVYYQVSPAGAGGVWWNPRVNITKNSYGEDGYRPYTDLSVLIDSEENTHVVWNARTWVHDAANPCDTKGGRMFHYSEGTGLTTVVHPFDWEQVNCDGGAWNLNASKMTLSECDGKLYCIFVQYNDIPAGRDDDCAMYYTGGANGDLYVSVSDDWGMTWDRARNLTNTYTPDCDSGECESEVYPSMVKFGTDYVGIWPSDPEFIVDPSVPPDSPYVGDWYLDVQYINDHSAGCIVQTEGYWDLADVKWFRLPCVEPVPAVVVVVVPDTFTIIDLPPGLQLDTSFYMENLGNLDFIYTILVEEDNGPPGWLGAAPPSGVVPPSQVDTGTASINQGGIIQTSMHVTGRIIIHSNASSSPDTIEVDVTVTAPDLDSLDVIPDTLMFTANQNGPLPASQSFQVEEIDGGNIPFGLAETSPWFDLDKTGGTTPEAVQASILTTSLAPGTYLDSVTVSSPVADNSPVYEFIKFIVTPAGTCDWNPGDTHKMHYPQLPNDTGWDVNATYPLVLADDFRCMQTGYIKDIHFWGSWRHNDVGVVDSFLLSFHADIPADQNPEGYSKPGDSLWHRVITDWEMVAMDPRDQGWFDPSDTTYILHDHADYFQYNVCLDSADWFYQDSNTIYWLNISAFVFDTAQFRWGWKSSDSQWNDDGVWAFIPDYDWEELYDLGGVTYVPGDVDDNGVVNTADTAYLFAFLYLAGPAPPYTDPNCPAPWPAADANGDCWVDALDYIYLGFYLGGTGPAPTYCPNCPPEPVPGGSLDLAFVITGEPGEPPTCCNGDGMRGNADDIVGAGGEVDVADLTYLVAYLFQGGPAPPCLPEGNVDGVTGAGGPVDVADLTHLVAYLFLGGNPPAPC